MKRTGLKLFSLCVLALGLVAFSASAAQAAGTWMVKNANLTSGSKELVGTLNSPGGKLLTTIGANTYIFACTAGELLNAKLETEGKVSETNKNAKADFTGCTMTVNGTLAPKCEPTDGITKGVILTEEWYGLLGLHTGAVGVTVITPKVGTLLAIIHMGAKETCAFGLEVEVFGTLAVKDAGGNIGLEEEKVNHTIEEFEPLTSLKAFNEGVSAKAKLDGTANIKLTSGEVWNGLAG